MMSTESPEQVWNKLIKVCNVGKTCLIEFIWKDYRRTYKIEHQCSYVDRAIRLSVQCERQAEMFTEYRHPCWYREAAKVRYLSETASRN